MFRSNNRSALILVVLVSAAAWMVAYNATVAANPVSAPPDAKGRRAGELKIKPDKHDFGQVAQGVHSSALIVTATNSSKSASIDFISIVASSPFAIQSDLCSGLPLAAGKSCQVQLQFVPNGQGTVKLKHGLIFNDSAKNSPQDVELKGDGIPGPTATATITTTIQNTPTPSISATQTLTPTPPPGATPTVTHTPVLPTPTRNPTPKPAFFAEVTAGGSPVAGSSVAVWQPGSTGFGMGATQIPFTGSMTDSNGSFYSGIFVCPSDNTEIYVTVQGGNPGGGANSSLMMMGDIGPCDTIGFGGASFFVNEVTTAASVYALTQFLSTSTPGIVGAPASDTAALMEAFGTLSTLVDPRIGTALSGAAQETLNSIANALAVCNLTNGASSPACTELFDCALPGAVFSAGACSGGTGSVTDTLSAALSIALNPTTVSVDGIFDVSTKDRVYSPALSAAPPDWSLP